MQDFRKKPILLVEDNIDDVHLLKTALHRVNVAHPLQVVSNAEAAQDYLLGTGPYEDRDLYPFPLLILLDLYMPGVTGFDLLAWIRKQPDLLKILVIVLSISSERSDIVKAFELGANGYLIKTESFEKVAEMLRLALGR